MYFTYILYTLTITIMFCIYIEWIQNLWIIGHEWLLAWQLWGMQTRLHHAPGSLGNSLAVFVKAAWEKFHNLPDLGSLKPLPLQTSVIRQLSDFFQVWNLGMFESNQLLCSQATGVWKFTSPGE